MPNHTACTASAPPSFSVAAHVRLQQTWSVMQETPISQVTDVPARPGTEPLDGFRLRFGMGMSLLGWAKINI